MNQTMICRSDEPEDLQLSIPFPKTLDEIRLDLVELFEKRICLDEQASVSADDAHDQVVTHLKRSAAGSLFKVSAIFEPIGTKESDTSSRKSGLNRLWRVRNIDNARRILLDRIAKTRNAKRRAKQN